MIDAYLQIGDIKGESQDDKHKGWIEVIGVHWGVSQPRATAISTAGGHTSGKADVHEVSFDKLADIASPVLFQTCAMGKTIPKAKFEFFRADGDGSRVKYFEIELENVIISTSIRPAPLEGSLRRTSIWHRPDLNAPTSNKRLAAVLAGRPQVAGIQLRTRSTLDQEAAMPHPVVYPGNFNALLKEWEEKAKQVYKEQGKDGLKHLMIANGECARLPQALTGVGWTGRWQRGERVIDVARTLKPGTVIANFRFIDGKWQYPRGGRAEVHGNHAALFMSADSYVEGKPTRVMMFDQWRSGTPKWPSPRPVYVRPEAIAKAKQPCDRAEDFYVVLVP